LRGTVFFAVGCFACLWAGESRPSFAGVESTKSIYVVNHNDWHTGIVIRREDVPGDLWPERQAFGDSEYLEVGWGDRDYYQSPDPTVWITLKAALWRTDSVLHIIGFNEPVEDFFRGSEMVELRVSVPRLERLSAFIQDKYARDASDRVIELGPGLYENSRFYLARGKFHFLNTCNVWTAEAIRSAGIPVKPSYAVRARILISQLKEHGRMIPAERLR
jgi:uncharacterized protein (TIGR02117 family)